MGTLLLLINCSKTAPTARSEASVVMEMGAVLEGKASCCVEDKSDLARSKAHDVELSHFRVGAPILLW